VKTYVVTGASTGIGAATALALASGGATIYAGVRNEVDAQRIGALHERLHPLMLDVTDDAGIASALARVRAEGTGLDGLVNNAGIAIAGPLETIPRAELRRQFEVNCVGAVAVTQAFLPLLRERLGRVVFVGSVSGRIAVPYIAPYSASKFALRALADALRVELAPSGVAVCLVEPGSVATPIWQKGRAMRDAMLERVPIGTPDYYRAAIETVVRGTEAEERAGMPVERVAEAIVRALTERRPRAHRIVGASAVLGAIIALLPPGLHDRFLRATMRLP
jgi:NAD(P)-dependent dehydrogenase (short-subunit alcohol dehydrogenase family)